MGGLNSSENKTCTFNVPKSSPKENEIRTQICVCKYECERIKE